MTEQSQPRFAARSAIRRRDGMRGEIIGASFADPAHPQVQVCWEDTGIDYVDGSELELRGATYVQREETR